jgi:hypothetical protein
MIFPTSLSMATIFTIHGGFSTAITLYFLILGVWGFVRAIRGQQVDGNYLGGLVIVEVLIIIQGILGTALWVAGNNVNVTRFEIHLLYGVFGVIFLPFVYMVMLRGDTSNRGQWVLSFTTLFLFGIALRAIATSI